MVLKIVCVAAGGAVGAVARVEMTRVIGRVVSTLPMHLGLLAVNLLGCFAFGVIWAVLERRAMLDSAWGWLLLGGALGAFTTFSTFAFESAYILQRSGPAWTMAQVLAHNLLGIALIFAGIAIAQRVLAPA